jgi:hypothetical protein
LAAARACMPGLRNTACHLRVGAISDTVSAGIQRVFRGQHTVGIVL